LAEGTIANAAFDPGHPFYDGTVFHRVVPGHVIQAGSPKSDRAKGPGYTFPNEIHARLSHNHAGALNMANGGPNTNASQFCIMLGDRSYLDGDFNVFGDVVEGLDVVMKIVQGDVVASVRIVRIGAEAQKFRPTTESFQAQVHAAEKQVTEQVEKKRIAEREWIASHYPKATGPQDGVLTEQVTKGKPSTGGGAVQVLYHGSEIRYVGDVIGREGPPIDVIPFASDDKGLPAFVNSPRVFAWTKVNPGLDGVIAAMQPGERRIVIVPAALAYGRAGSYPPEIPGIRRFAISPNALLVYDVQVIAK
jgi:peptidylprolyl isomerase